MLSLVRSAAVDVIDWLGTSALFKPKSNLFADWLANDAWNRRAGPRERPVG
jgi:hypothetical protein